MRKLIAISFTVILGSLLVASIVYGRYSEANVSSLPYSMVLLDSGHAFVGKLSGLDSTTPELTDVYYIRTEVDSASKQQKNMLRRRGDEAHQPTHMTLLRTHIVLIENVTPGSEFMRLIHNAKQ